MATHAVRSRGAPALAQRALLAWGIVYAALYAVVNDVIAASLYTGYSRLSQAVSELSATGAPTRGFLSATLPIFTVLIIGFGVAVWRAGAGRRALRIAGAALVGHGVTALLWLAFPMTSRADMVAGTMPSNDLGHIVMSMATVTFIVVQVVAGGLGLGRGFRLYSLATVVAVLGFGGLTARASAQIASGAATPWLGLLERLSIGAWLLWMALFALALRRREASQGRAA